MSTFRKNRRNAQLPLTTAARDAKIAPHAGMVELVDSVDLGAVTSVEVFLWK